MKIAVIGAGLSGIVAAKNLHEQLGHMVEVTIFEKSRGSGGRMSTRRASRFEFDHGAQYFTVKEPRFQMAVNAAIAQGYVAPWDCIAKYFKGNRYEADNGGRRYVCTPRMNSWIKAMASGLHVNMSAQVTGIYINMGAMPNGNWCLSLEDGTNVDGFKYVIAAVPAPQAEILLSPVGFNRLQSIKDAQMEACFAVMIGFDREISLPWHTLRREDGPASWLAVNSAKPGRTESGTALVIHSGPDWSAANVDRDKSEIQEEILNDISALIDTDFKEAAYVTIHRWLYAAVTNSADSECLADANLGVIACGDWCLGGRVEGAYLSGIAAAQQIIDWAE